MQNIIFFVFHLFLFQNIDFLSQGGQSVTNFSRTWISISGHTRFIFFVLWTTSVVVINIYMKERAVQSSSISWTFWSMGNVFLSTFGSECFALNMNYRRTNDQFLQFRFLRSSSVFIMFYLSVSDFQLFISFIPSISTRPEQAIGSTGRMPDGLDVT